MKIFLMIPLLIISIHSLSQTNEPIDPTGTYLLGSYNEDNNGEIYGYFGQILIRKLDRETIIMSFEICKGAPSYNSGSFIDTLDYKLNRAIYKPGAEVDTSCEITFDITMKGISVDEKANNFNWGCGFGHAVVASGFFRKISSEAPEIIY